MSETVDDLTISYEEDGIEVVQELEKYVLSKGSWSTVMYKYREWNKGKEEYGPEKATIRRYQKRDGSYRQQSKFNISSGKQAKEMSDILQKWFDE